MESLELVLQSAPVVVVLLRSTSRVLLDQEGPPQSQAPQNQQSIEPTMTQCSRICMCWAIGPKI